MSDYKRILLVDFDGVIHSYKSGWKGYDQIPDPVVPGAIDWLLQVSVHYDVAIYSSRSKDPEGLRAMKLALGRWAREAGMPDLVALQFLAQLNFPTEKPPAYLTIDDRCICFRGIFPTVAELECFRPWYQSQPSDEDPTR